MTRDDWECSFGHWQAQNRRSTLIGKAILDPDCLVRCYPTRSHGPARNHSYGNSGSRSLPRDHRSSGLQLTPLAFSPSCSPNLRDGVRLDHDATDKGRVSPLRLWRLQLADTSTLLFQRCNLRAHSIFSSNTPRIPHNNYDPRTSPSYAHSHTRRRIVLLTPEPPQNTILFVR